MYSRAAHESSVNVSFLLFVSAVLTGDDSLWTDHVQYNYLSEDRTVSDPAVLSRSPPDPLLGSITRYYRYRNPNKSYRLRLLFQTTSLMHSCLVTCEFLKYQELD